MPSRFPGGRAFAFTIFDDTDDGTVANLAPVYGALRRYGLRTTKTAWVIRHADASSAFRFSETLEDPAYLEFVAGLAADGFEIGWHGAAMESSNRQTTLAALERHHELFNGYPRVFANHAQNRENLYWGADRVDSVPLRLLYRLAAGKGGGGYEGHLSGSPYFWGDVCHERVTYGRNLTFDAVNLCRINPTLPYRDPRRPLVRWWFSATDAEDADAFTELLTEPALDALEAEGGVCIVATHLGKGFARGGALRPDVEAVLKSLHRRNGWYVPVGPLLDHLAGTGGGALPAAEWRRMQWRWAVDLVHRTVRRRRRRAPR